MRMKMFLIAPMFLLFPWFGSGIKVTCNPAQTVCWIKLKQPAATATDVWVSTKKGMRWAVTVSAGTDSAEMQAAPGDSYVAGSASLKK